NILSFSIHDANPDLPTFPTRRSSDLIAAFVYRPQHIVLRTEVLEIIPFIVITERGRQPLGRRMQRINHMECSFLRMWMAFEIATYQSAEPSPVVLGV